MPARRATPARGPPATARPASAGPAPGRRACPQAAPQMARHPRPLGEEARGLRRPDPARRCPPLVPLSLLPHPPAPHHYYVYIASSQTRVLYIGVTNDLERRVTEHRSA